MATRDRSPCCSTTSSAAAPAAARSTAPTNQIAPGGADIDRSRPSTAACARARVRSQAAAAALAAQRCRRRHARRRRRRSARQRGATSAEPQPIGRGDAAAVGGELGEHSSGGGGAAAGVLPGVRITADAVNNTLLIYANQENYRIIEQTLRQLDRPQLQVAIDATIAEITLNDNLNYGVQFFLRARISGVKPDKGSVDCQRRRRRACSPRASRIQFPARLGSRAAPDPRRAAWRHRREGAVDPSLVVLDNQTATLAGRRPGAGLDRHATC